jgi:alpha-beta hydrolase superfamily lysophospholipase
MTRRWLLRARRLAGALALALLALLAVRVWESERGQPLGAWHTFAPEELRAQAIDRSDWAGWLAAEEAVFAAVRERVTETLPGSERILVNRYYDGSPLHGARFPQDWNRSQVLEPDGAPRGALVFLHGLTDSPYSGRHLAERYRAHGFVAVLIRLPGHGTVPAGLTAADWEDWAAATRLAVREAARRIGPSLPLHLAGYSNGGALAVQYTLDALEDETLRRPDRVVLLSPMIGVTAFARFAGLAGLPALLPRFAKAAWLSVTPEFNPFKYNSFPVHAARQTHRLTQALQRQIARLAAGPRWAELPPLLTFQSVVDFTVSTRSIVEHLYARLPANGSELVLYDLNRNARFGPLLRAGPAAKLDGLLPPAPRAFRATLLANARPDGDEVEERSTGAGATGEQRRPLGLAFPRQVFSLSHVALPFPTDDPLYGLDPDPGEDFGVRLGALATRGELGALVVDLESLLRLLSNPFFPYQMARIEETLP